jgi:hypothetical protein
MANRLKSDAPDASLRGVSLEYLLEFTYEHNLWNVPTYEVVQRVVAPATIDTDGQPYTSLLPAVSVGSPSIFLSHAWANPFGLVVAAARKYVSDEAKRKRKHTKVGHSHTFLWLDIFAVSQHPGAQQQHDLTRLEATIARPDCTTLVVLDNAGLPLQRCWCVYEFFATLLHAEGKHGKLQVRAGSMVPRSAEFIPCADPERLAELSVSVNVTEAEATVAADKQMILARLAELGVGTRSHRDGTHELNRKLARAVRRGW